MANHSVDSPATKIAQQVTLNVDLLRLTNSLAEIYIEIKSYVFWIIINGDNL